MSNTTRTAADYAADYNLFCEFIEPGRCCGIESAEQFHVMPIDERQTLAQQVIDANA